MLSPDFGKSSDKIGRNFGVLLIKHLGRLDATETTAFQLFGKLTYFFDGANGMDVMFMKLGDVF